MISYSSKPVVLDKVKDLPHFFEAIWIHKKIKNIICLIPMGSVSPTAWLIPSMVLYEYKGRILDEVNSGTNHSSIVEYKGQWYLFLPYGRPGTGYNHADSPDRKYIQWRRSVCMAPLFYNEDGTIQPVKQSSSITIPKIN